MIVGLVWLQQNGFISDPGPLGGGIEFTHKQWPNHLDQKDQLEASILPESKTESSNIDPEDLDASRRRVQEIIRNDMETTFRDLNKIMENF